MITVSSLFNIEKERDLSEIRLDQHWFYPVIKQIIAASLPSNHNNLTSAHPKKSIFLKKIFIDFYYTFIKSSSKKSADFLIFDSTQSRRFEVENKNYSVYSDPLIDLLPNSILVESSRTFEPYYVKKPYTKNIVYDDFFIDLIYIRAKWYKKNREAYSINKGMQQTGLEYSLKNTLRLVAKFNLIKNHYRRLLIKYKPKGVFIVCAYDYKRMALVAACKELNIITVELQHGIILQSPGYIYKQMVERYYTPDYLFAYGQTYKDLILTESCLFLPNQIKVTGSLFLEQYVKRNLKKIHDQKILDFTKNKKVILFSSQFTVNNELRLFVLELSQRISTEYCILYKPHPNEKKTAVFYSDFFTSGNILLVNENIISLICLASFHSTVYSTTGLEASYFHVPNIYIEVKGYTETILPFIDKNKDRLAKNVNDYLEFLDELENNNTSNMVFDNSFEFYTSRPIQKTQNALNEIFNE